VETIVLGSDAAAASLGSYFQHVGPAGAEVRDAQGRLIGYLFPPHMPAADRAFREGWEFGRSHGIDASRPKGKTTQELLTKLNEIPLSPNPTR
jgi:hypothetical protein